MGDARLVFSAPQDGSGRLVFGDTGGGEVIPDAPLGIDADLPGLDYGGPLVLRVGTGLSIDVDLPGLDGTVVLDWDANVSRPTVAQAGICYQRGAPVRAAAADAYARALPVSAGAVALWQHAAPVEAALRQGWSDSQRMQSAAAAAWQAAAPVAVPALRQGWQSAQRLRAAVLQHWQDAERLRAAALARYQDMLRLRLGLRDAFQPAQHLRASVSSREGRGAPLRIALGARYQRAWVPRPGIYIPPEPPVRPPCYDPATLGRLVFEAPSDGTGHLVFVCERGGPGPQPPRFVIPVLEVYMSMHQLSAVLLPSLEPVDLLEVTIDSDDGGMGWSLSASGPEHLLEQLAPVGGLPARIRVTIDGFDWVFAVERIGRTRSFGRHRCSIQGRSATALLGEPYMPQQSWLGTSLQTAQQLVAGALEFTGTTLNWGISDWLVPAGAWSYTGTPLQAALRVADSVGAVVRSHRTDQRLVFAPRYPVLPWEWDAAVPDVQMPADIITTDGLDPDPRPAYNAVYVSGQAQGVPGHVRRAGTAGDFLAPQVTDALITHADAARQRGIAVLGAAGNKLAHRMTLPFLTGGTNPGPVLPGYLIEVADIGHTWRGLVRGISISASMPVVRQTINVERNA